MDNLSLLAALVNAYERLRSGKTDILEEIIQSVLVDHEVGFQPAGGYYGGRIRGHDYTVFWAKAQMNKALGPYPDTPFLAHENGQLVPTTRRESLGSMFMANDQKIKDDFLSMLALQAKNASIFAEICRKTGHVPFDFINERFEEIQQNNHILKFSGTIEHPTLTLLTIPIQYATIEDEIETKAYLAPFLAGEGAKWTRNRYCEECGKLFFYKLERARFCSQECRIRANNKARREK